MIFSFYATLIITIEDFEILRTTGLKDVSMKASLIGIGSVNRVIRENSITKGFVCSKLSMRLFRN